MRIFKSKRWMIQMGNWAGPINLGIHASVLPGCPHYLDIHLPYCVITLGNIGFVEYPPECWFSAKDQETGVKYLGRDKQ